MGVIACMTTRRHASALARQHQLQPPPSTPITKPHHLIIIPARRKHYAVGKMRLIHADSLELRTFNDESQSPPYAILSHTWGGSEVSFQDFGNVRQAVIHGALTESQGCWKIVRACQQALEDGLDYAWVDTCCIDKTSSAELSEAINSMFRWYNKAEVCYAYLDDVKVHSEAGVDDVLSDERVSIHELEKARWFTRGWTLQELIAPTHLRFYEKGWKCMGDKMSLCATLQQITGISVDILRGSELQDVSIAERMSWMARRQTTRAEDLAYSLMGIFDVNMPLLYGEGNKAFVRLQEEIMKDSADHSLFTWNARDDSLDIVRRGPYLASIFAEHPRQFANSTGMIKSRFDDPGITGESYALTNLGVQIQLRMFPYDKPEFEERYKGQTYLAILNCQYKIGPPYRTCRPGILLEQLSSSRPHFARVENAGMIPVVPVGITDETLTQLGAVSVSPDVSPKTIYLRKKVPRWAQNSRSDCEDETDANWAESIAGGYCP